MRVLRCLADSHDIPYSVLEKIDEFRREMFTAEYQFHDAAHMELDAHTLPFTIEVLP